MWRRLEHWNDLMAAPFQTKLPPWVVNSGQQTAWNAANPATQKDWMRNPAWRPKNPNTMSSSLYSAPTTPGVPPWDLSTGAVPAGYNQGERDPITGAPIRNQFTDAIAEMGRGRVPQGIPGTATSTPNPNDFKSYEDWIAAGLAAGGNEWQLRNPTILSSGVKKMWGLDPGFRDPKWDQMRAAKNPAVAAEAAGAANALAFNAAGPAAQTPWFQSPWGAASKSKELPYWMGGYGRRA